MHKMMNFLITTYLLYFNYKNQFHYRMISKNPNNPICVLISTLGGRFPRARLQPRANKRSSVGRVIAVPVPVPGRGVLSLWSFLFFPQESTTCRFNHYCLSVK